LPSCWVGVRKRLRFGDFLTQRGVEPSQLPSLGSERMRCASECEGELADAGGVALEEQLDRRKAARPLGARAMGRSTAG
jgi:hypothetical protein